MSASRVAVRYARALVETLAEKKSLDDANAFLSFCDAVKQHSELSSVFANVTVNAKSKSKLVLALAKEAQLPEVIGRFLSVLAMNGRLNILAEIKRAVSQQLDEQNNITPVVLTTAVSPTDEQLGQISTSMEQSFGKKVRLDCRQDEDILGGAIAQVGSVVYDGSIRGQLSKLRGELVKENK